MLELQLAWRNLLRQKRRSILTGISIAGGYFLITFAVSLIEGSYFVELPVDVRAFDVGVILLCGLLACLLITALASRPLLRHDLMSQLR